MNHNQILLSLFNEGIGAVSGRNSVENALRDLPDFKPDRIVAVGKAAADMVQGTQSLYGNEVPTLLATKYQHCDSVLKHNPAIQVIESGHPIPDHNSLQAGQQILELVESMQQSETLLLLVSGGASAIAEHLQPGLALTDWQAMNEELVASGKDIEQINARRKAVSRIKGGRLLENFQGKEVVVCAISDVRGDSLATIGSGIGEVSKCPSPHRVLLVASNQAARSTVAEKAKEMGLTVRLNSESLYGDVYALAREIGNALLHAKPGLYIWGGEPTIALPDQPGEGGRNQSLALALALEVRGHPDIHILVAGTDGTDGPTLAAGGIVDGSTVLDTSAAHQALAEANAGPYLEKTGARLKTGPTGTNVMDLLLALVE